MRRECRCYELAWKHILDVDEFADWLLIHGEVTGPDGSRIGHAWLENYDRVFDPVLSEFFSTALYRIRFGPTYLQEYDRKQAVAMVLRTNHAGPWDESEALLPIR